VENINFIGRNIIAKFKIIVLQFLTVLKVIIFYNLHMF
jgi:hypothetical protein